MATATANLMDDPAYKTAVDNLNRLKNRRRELESSIDASRNESMSANRVDRVGLLVAGKSLKDAPRPSVLASEVYSELGLLPAAIERAESGLQQAAAAASKPIAAAAKSEYRELIRQMLKSMIATANASWAASEFTADLDARGISWLDTFVPVAYGHLGNPNDVQSRLWWKLLEAVRDGYATLNELAGWGAPIKVCDEARAMLKAMNQ